MTDPGILRSSSLLVISMPPMFALRPNCRAVLLGVGSLVLGSSDQALPAVFGDLIANLTSSDPASGPPPARHR